MNHDIIKQSELLNSIQKWGLSNNNVRALIQTGSLVRQDNTADEFSDLDLEVLVRDSSLLIKNDIWIFEIGRPITILHLDKNNNQDWPTRLVIFEKGVKVDFTIIEMQRIEKMINTATLDPLYERGYAILFDKDELTKQLPKPNFFAPCRSLPSREHFQERVEEFWFEAFHIPRYLMRKELFLVKQRDWTMKELLLEMTEWHALTKNNGSIDIWHMGKNIHSWTDSTTLKQLHKAFGHFDEQDAYQAYNVTTQLYSRLAKDVAKMNKWTYPTQVEELILMLDPVKQNV